MSIVKKYLAKTRSLSVFLSVVLSVFVFGYTVIAWTPAPSNPPNCPAGYPGCDVPLNISNAGQTKGGGLILNTAGWPYGLSVPAGNVGIGTLAPTARLQISPDISNTTYRPLYVSNNGSEANDIHTAAFVNNTNFGVVVGAENPDTFGSIDAGNFVNGKLTTARNLILNRSGGQVGIGTANPGSKLTISGGDAYVASQGSGIILKDSIDGSCHRLVVANDALSLSAAMACPSF